MSRRKLPARLCPFARLCAHAGVSKEDATRLFIAIADTALDGYLVSVPRFGRFYVSQYPARVQKMPRGPGKKRALPTELDGTPVLRFRPVMSLKKRLRLRLRGKMRGTRSVLR